MVNTLLETTKDRRKEVKELRVLNRDLVNVLIDATEYANDGTIKGDETLIEKYFELTRKAEAVSK